MCDPVSSLNVSDEHSQSLHVSLAFTHMILEIRVPVVPSEYPINVLLMGVRRGARSQFIPMLQCHLRFPPIASFTCVIVVLFSGGITGFILTTVINSEYRWYGNCVCKNISGTSLRGKGDPFLEINDL